jgi:hypothetical protein
MIEYSENKQEPIFILLQVLESTKNIFLKSQDSEIVNIVEGPNSAPELLNRILRIESQGVGLKIYSFSQL